MKALKMQGTTCFIWFQRGLPVPTI